MRILQKSIIDNLNTHFKENNLNTKHDAEKFNNAVEQITDRWFFYENVKDINYLSKNFTLHKDEKTDINKILTDLVWFKTIAKNGAENIRKSAKMFYKERMVDLQNIAKNTDLQEFDKNIKLFNDAMVYVLSYTLSNIISDNVLPNNKTIIQMTKYKRDKEITEIKNLNKSTNEVVNIASDLTNEKTLLK